MASPAHMTDHGRPPVFALTKFEVAAVKVRAVSLDQVGIPEMCLGATNTFDAVDRQLDSGSLPLKIERKHPNGVVDVVTLTKPSKIKRFDPAGREIATYEGALETCGPFNTAFLAPLS